MPREVPQDAQVRCVRVVVHATYTEEVANVNLNHWTIFLLLDDNKSVRLNMRAVTLQEYPELDEENIYYGDPGKMVVTAHGYQVSRSAISYMDFPVNSYARVRVKDFLNICEENGRQYYTMAIGGSGCRYWVWTVMTDFSESDFIPGNSASILFPSMMKFYRLGDDGVTVLTDDAPDMPQGRFWLESEWVDEFGRYGF